MKQISIQQLYRYVNNKNAVIVDLRDKNSYKKQHVKNAVNITIEEIEAGRHNLSKNKEIVLYCERGGLSARAVRILEKEGYNAKSVVGGLKALKDFESN